MPSKEPLSACIKCGRPSVTVVCTSCFLNYDPLSYRVERPHSHSYVSRSECQTPSHSQEDSAFHSEFQSLYDSEFESAFSEELDHDTSSTLWVEDDFPELPEKIEEKPDPQKSSYRSWFSRLPRF